MTRRAAKKAAPVKPKVEDQAEVATDDLAGARAHDGHGNVRPADGRFPLVTDES